MAKEKEKIDTSDLTPKQRLKLLVKEEQTQASKKDEQFKVGKISDFKISSLDAIMPTGLLAFDYQFNGLVQGRIFELIGEESRNVA